MLWVELLWSLENSPSESVTSIGGQILSKTGRSGRVPYVPAVRRHRCFYLRRRSLHGERRPPCGLLRSGLLDAFGDSTTGNKVSVVANDVGLYDDTFLSSRDRKSDGATTKEPQDGL